MEGGECTSEYWRILITTAEELVYIITAGHEVLVESSS
jgi:hypothetical protein